MKRRSAELSSIRKSVSGGDGVAQLSYEVHHSHNREERQNLIAELSALPGNSKISVDPAESLAFKTTLTLPWSKLRVIRR